MSSNTYTMKLVVDDSAIKKLEERLGKIMGVGGGGLAGSVDAAGGGGGGGSSPFKQLGKLALIAGGITALVAMVAKITEKIVDSSPALQAMLKILDASVTLILRPFGDFIAFFLKPILIMFLRQVALPFYKYVAPLFRAWGTEAGEGAAGNLSSNIKGLTGILTGDLSLIEQAMSKAKGDWLRFWAEFDNWWANAFSGLPTWDELWAGIVGWFESLQLPSLEDTWMSIVNWFESIEVPQWMTDIWNGITDFFGTLKLPEWMNSTWGAITGFFALLVIPPWMIGIWAGLTTWFSTLTIPDWLVGIWEGVVGFFSKLEIPQWVKDIVDGFFNFIKKIGDWLASIPKFISDFFGFSSPDSSGGGSKEANLNIQIDGFLEDAGRGLDEQKEKILGWFNEWLK